MASISSGIGENMEDRYLFKAKHFDAWHIETIVKEPSGLYIRDIMENVMAPIVDESSICQFTGLKDKNGKLIWENDVVKATVRQNSLCQSSTYSNFYQISYQEKYCYFYLKKKNNNLLFDGNWSYYLKIIEVIGNIFDNPELLESEE